MAKASKKPLKKSTKALAKSRPALKAAGKPHSKAVSKSAGTGKLGTKALTQSDPKPQKAKLGSVKPAGSASAKANPSKASPTKANPTKATVSLKVTALKSTTVVVAQIKSAPKLSRAEQNQLTKRVAALSASVKKATGKSTAVSSSQPKSAPRSAAATRALSQAAQTALNLLSTRSRGPSGSNVVSSTKRDLKRTAKAAGASVKDRLGNPTFNSHGEQVCREVACEGLATSHGYCRMHYIKNWKKIQAKNLILKERKLNVYIEELIAKYPDKYIEAIREDLANEGDFAKVVVDLELDETVHAPDEGGFDSDEDSDQETVIDSIRRDFDEGGGGTAEF